MSEDEKQRAEDKRQEYLMMREEILQNRPKYDVCSFSYSFRVWY